MSALTIAFLALGYVVVGVCAKRFIAWKWKWADTDDGAPVAATVWPVVVVVIAVLYTWRGIDFLLFESWRRKAERKEKAE